LPEYIIQFARVKLPAKVSALIAIKTVSILIEHSPNIALLILAVDTSTKTTGLSLARGTVMIEATCGTEEEMRSERLWIDIERLLARQQLKVSDVDLFAVCTGPGGFTGLRVGLAAIKGLAAASKKPVVGVTSLEAAAFSARGSMKVCSLVNAYKNEIYSQLFSFADDGAPLPQNDPAVSTIEEALARLAKLRNLAFAGDGAEMYREALENPERGWVVTNSPDRTAKSIAEIGLIKFKRGEMQCAADLNATYVRPSEAEIKLSLGLLGTKIKRSLNSG